MVLFLKGGRGDDGAAVNDPPGHLEIVVSELLPVSFVLEEMQTALAVILGTGVHHGGVEGVSAIETWLDPDLIQSPLEL